jgi:hypothetical protein
MWGGNRAQPAFGRWRRACSSSRDSAAPRPATGRDIMPVARVNAEATITFIFKILLQYYLIEFIVWHA